MGQLLTKHFDQPDEVITQPNLTGQILTFGEIHLGRYIHEPGWSWSNDVKPQVGTESCQFRHLGMVLTGRLRVVSDEGAPGHDASVVGDEPCVTLDFLGARDWARPANAADRVLVTLLFTDLVDSTATAARVGDAAWKQLLARHFDRVRSALDRFHGYEVNTTGDGFLAIFNGAERAVLCAAAVCQAAPQDGLQVRAGVHSGDVERSMQNVQGVAVNVAARVMALAGPGEVLLSAATVALLEGTGLSFADTGERELKGLQGLRRIYRLIGDPSLGGG